MSETPSTAYSVNQPNSSESEQSLSTRHFNVTEPVVAKRICFYKSGDPQFNGIKMVINNRSYKTFDALLDSLSKRVPLPFGVRNISTPKGRHSITNLEDLEDGKSYICSHQRKMKPINLEQASKKPLPWQISRPVSARRRAVQLARENEGGYGHREIKITTPKKMLVFKNGDVRLRRTIVLGKKNTQTFEAFLDYMSELMQYPVAKLYTTDGRKVPNLQALILCSGALVAAGREPFKPNSYDSLVYSRPAKLLGIANRVYPKANDKSESENTRAEMGSSSRSQIFSFSSDKVSSNDNNSDSSYVPEGHNCIRGNRSVTGEDLSVAQYEDDIEKSVHLNQDGSITVEMKVRLKIKEEETIKWTTTVSRAGLSDDKNTIICNSAMPVEDCLSNVNGSECIKPKDTPYLKSCSKEEGDSLQQFNAEGSDKESESDLKTAGCNVHKNSSADLGVSNEPEDDIRPRFYRPPTPGPRRVRQKKAVVESVTLVSEEEVQEKTIGQFSYSEETENGENKSEYCMVAHSSRKKSNVINPKFSEMSDNDLLKLSSDNIKEEMLFKVSHKSSDLIEATNRKTEVPGEGELVQNILEKSVVEQGTYNSLVSTCKTNISGFVPSSKLHQAARPVSADHIHELCDIKQIKRSLSSFIRYSELCQSKEETICKAADLLPISQDSVNSASLKHSRVKIMVPPCREAVTEKINPTSGFFPTDIGSENQSSVKTGSVTTPHLTDDRESASSLTKKKKRKSSNFLEQVTYENQKDRNISGILKSEGMHITSQTTQDYVTEAMDNSSDMLHKKEKDFFVKSNEGSVNSENKICPGDEFYQEDSGEKNGLSSNKETSNNKKLAKKQKKQKGVRKNLSKGANKLNMPERVITLEALKQEDFQPLVEHSLENYVQSWLKNLLPNSVLPPINKQEGNVENSSNFPKENTDVSIGKETRLIANKVHVTEKNHLVEKNLTKKLLKPICEVGTLDKSAKDSGEKQADSLIHAHTTIVEAAKYSLKSELHHDGKVHLFHETHENDKKMSEADSQDTNLYQRKKSEVAVQVDCTIVNEKMGIDVQNNCMSSMLLQELQSTLLGLQKEHNGCIGKACSLSDLSPSTFGSSSNVLLAWLLVLNLRESLIGTIKDDMQKNTCSCSEIFTQLHLLKQTTVIEKVDELKAAFSHFQQPTENNLVHFGKELKKQDSTYCHENASISEIHNGIHLHENEKSVEPCIPKNCVNSEEALKLTGEIESCFNMQEDICSVTETLDLSAPSPQLDDQYANTNSNTCSLAAAILSPERNEEMPDGVYEKSQDKDTDTSFTNEETETSVEPNSTVHSVTSNDKNILDQDTSEVEGEKYVLRVSTDKSEDEKLDPKSAGNDKNSNNQLKLAAETSVEYNNEDYSVQEDKEGEDTCEETSERLSTTSPLSFCYESKQMTECDTSEEEQKFQVELQNKMCSDTSQLKKCLKSPATSDLSDYRPDTEESAYDVRASSDLTNESADEAALEKHYNTGYVKRTIERLYGKTEASFKPDFHNGFPYLSKVLQKDTEEFHSAVVEKNVHFFQEACSVDKLSHSSLPSQEFSINIDKGNTILREENTSLPTPQPTPSREETSYTNGCSGESSKQHRQLSVRDNEDEGILIDKGKWLLKENHLIRRSPPEQFGMYGNLDTTSTDTVLDTNSDDVPYSHFGNLNQYPDLKEISSSELEDMAKPSENFCNYFNIPHNSDSDPFQDDFSTKSKPSCNGKITSLPAANKEKIKPSIMVGSTSTQADSNFPSFTTVEFRLPDNKVHPLEPPLNDEPIQTQPQPNDVSNANRNALQEEDSLDKLHAICGQHCPILMVTVTPINEEQRGYAYQKPSDIENQLGPCLLAKKSEYLKWSEEDLVTDKNNHVTLKNNCINKIANNIFNRFYANNTLDFINNFGILVSSTLKDASNLRKLHVLEYMNVKHVKVCNCQNNMFKHIPSDLVIGNNSELPNRKPKICQTLRISLVHIVGAKFSPILADPAEACHSETFLKCDTSLNNTESNASENLKNENAFPTEDEDVCFRTVDNENSKDEKDFVLASANKIKGTMMERKVSNTARKWKVSVLTSDMPAAGTSSKVYITLYGDRSSSGPIFLDGEEGKLFQRGNEDIFTVQLLNLFSGEQFSFPAHRWLAWDQADGEISMELPVLHQGQPILPVTVYEVHVTTGELWNAGTEADVYISVYGERGDTGSRQLLRSQKLKKFLKGQTDIFAVEAVHLGHLYKTVIGHNGLGSGNGWFLDKVVIKDPVTDLDYTFLCYRWLDQGQDDGNIARELTVTDASIFPGSLFDVNVKGRNICIFSSHEMPCLALALVNGHVIGKSKDKTCCELCIHLQPNGCAILESARNPGHTVMFNLQGKVADETTGYAGLSKEFVVHVKGTGDEYCHFKIEKNLETGSVSLESVQNEGIYVGLLPDGQTKPVTNTGERNIFFYPQVIKFGREEPMGTSASPSREKKDFREPQLQPAKAQKPVSQNLSSFPHSEEMRNPQGGEHPFPSNDEWKVSVLTGNAGTEANVILWIYGDRGVAGTITLGKDNRKQLFLPSQEDEFQKSTKRQLKSGIGAKVKIKSMGYIYKIRIELDELLNEQSEGNLQRLFSKFFYTMFMSTLVMWNKLIQILQFICVIYGKRGDSSLRLLHKSGIPVVFQSGMVDVFGMEAVSLGKLQKVLLHCEANAKSQYWFCDKVIVREAEDNSEFVFNCERKETARLLLSLGILKQLAQQQQYPFMAYGEKKAFGPVILGSGKHQLFNPSSEDTFKKRETNWRKYLYEYLTVNAYSVPLCMGTLQEKLREDKELVKEFPAVNEDWKTLPVYKYVVSVHIGDCWGAETFANVYITFYGKRGNTGVRKLHTSLAKAKFPRNKVHSFLVQALSLSHFQKVVIGHDGEGCGAGMYMEMVTVKEEQDSDKEWVFPFWNWLDTHLGLCETVCEIVTVGKRLTSSPKLPEINMKSSGLWIMDITGSDLSNEEDPICLSFIFYGNLSHKKSPLQVTGKAIQIKDELTDVGSIYKVQVTVPHSKLKNPWHLDLLHMKHTGTKEEMHLAFDCWFNPNDDKCVELPAFYADQEPLPGSGWFLEKVEITDASGNSVYCFNCNRWLAEDESDGRTVVQLYPQLLDF
ncbi:PREDICTED: oxygen-regulated protein 1 [Merops nubicus]|uniref:oxygen-regulated protein 1 n=1 Tax=Merops nubicus TaxID=57421 RepID=UPI0004F0BB7C|nr:PREDICTED: oxygen-regulated protein 1 [Merops nubicus]